MTFENLLSSIQGLLAIGFVAGLLVGLLGFRDKIGCSILLTVPVAMVLYVGWWQGQHPENLRSTSGLDFVFGPLWPATGAIAGYYAAKWLRSQLSRP